MRLTRLPLNTYKEAPADAEVISHQLMLRAGLIRKLASGLFTWLPVGLKVLRRVEDIVREEMDRSDSFELLMPAVQPAELWQESGRWDRYGPLLLRMHDRHQREFCFGPTHEEVITDVARRELKSYKQLPVTYYQIQTKFRDEIRPRFGLMRAREFLMKDAYSFHVDQASLETTYQTMAETYERIFTRLGLSFRGVDADSGDIGGSKSREYHVLADSGEDGIAWCPDEDFAMNVELAPASPPVEPRAAASADKTVVPTPGASSIADVAAALEVEPEQCLKTLLVRGEDDTLVALLLRGDHELNTIKAEKLDGVEAPLTLASDDDVRDRAGSVPGYIGPVGLSGVRLIADHSALAMADFVCGANEADAHLSGVNWERDLPVCEAADLRNVEEGDLTPAGNPIRIARGIEVGHIFQLGQKYSESLGAKVLDSDGREVTMTMGCYGIGVSRIVAAAIEQNHDDNGIIWPEPLSPFHVQLISLMPGKNEAVRAAADELYAQWQSRGLDVLYDDRDARPGVKFAEADLLGVTHRVVIGGRGLEQGVVEYVHRRTGETQEVALADIAEFVAEACDR